MASAKKLPSGNWRVLAYVGTRHDGSRQYRSFTDPDKKQAEYKAALFSVKKSRDVSSVTVGEAIDRYVASKSDVLSPTTLKRYKAIRRLSFNGIAKERIDRLTDEQIQIAINTEARKVAPKTVKGAYSLLKSAVCLFNPLFRPMVTLPQPVRATIIIPTDEAVRGILSATTGNMHTAILCAALMGLRRSEICALEWTDIKGDTLRVNKALVLNEDKEWVIKTTKTTSSTRTLIMPSVVREYLMAQPRTGKRIVSTTPDTISTNFIRMRKEMGFDGRFHDLRHFFASTLLEMGVPDMYAAHRMGHSSTSMLKAVYQHLKDTKEKEIDAAIEDKMSALFG